MTDLAVWDWCLTGLMTAEHPLDTHRHTIQECRHTSDTYARADTGAGITRMDRRSHINWEVWKLVWTHTFSLEHRLSLTCVVCVFGLPAGQNESTCHDLLSVFEHAWFPYSLASESLGEDQIGLGTLWFRAPAWLPLICLFLSLQHRNATEALTSCINPPYSIQHHDQSLQRCCQ